MRASVGLGSLMFVLGIPASLGFGPWAAASMSGRGILGLMDFVAADILLPLNGLLLALFLGWIWKRGDAIAAGDLERCRLGRLWRLSLRYLVPPLIVAVLINGVLGA